MSRIPKSLSEKLKERRVIPFVGAGVSRAVVNNNGIALFPSWREVLERAAAEVEAEGGNKDVAELIRVHVKVNGMGDFLLAASRAKKELGGGWFDFLRKQFDLELQGASPNSLELAQLVWNLGSDFIITTNYDLVLEYKSPKVARSWDASNISELAKLLQAPVDHPTVWHLHGRIDNAEKIILAEEDYRRLYPAYGAPQNLEFQAAMKSLEVLLATRSLLFIGFSLEDAYFVQQLQSVYQVFKGASIPHYAILPRKESDTLSNISSVKPIYIDTFGEPLLKLMKEMAECTEITSPRSSHQVCESHVAAIPVSRAKAIEVATPQIVGNVSEVRDLNGLISRWKDGVRTKGLVVVGEEGTGKSLIISAALRQSATEAKIVKLSGSNYSFGRSNFILHVLAGLFELDPNYDGRLIEHLDEFCTLHKLIGAKRLVQFLRAMTEMHTPGVQDLNTIRVELTHTVPRASDNDKTSPEIDSPTFRPSRELWQVLVVASKERGQRTVLWLEDAQLFDGQNLDVIRDLFGCTPQAELLLIGEFRAERTRDLVRVQELYRPLTPHKIVCIKDLNEPETHDLIALTLQQDRSKMPRSLIADVFQASGGNPKYIVDFVAYLRQKNALTQNSAAENWNYDRSDNLLVPDEFRSMYLERIRLHNLSRVELSVLVLLGQLPQTDVPVRLVSQVLGSEAVAGIERLLSEVGIIRESQDTSSSEWQIRFEHLTAKEACRSLLDEDIDGIAEELLAAFRSTHRNENDESLYGSERLWRSVGRNLAVATSDADVLAEYAIFPIVRATNRDLPNLKTWLKVLRRNIAANDLTKNVTIFLSARIRELEGTELADLKSMYGDIVEGIAFPASLDDVVLELDMISMYASVFARLYAASMSQNDKVVVEFIEFRNRIWRSASTEALRDGAIETLCKKIFQELSTLRVDRLAFYRKVREEDSSNSISFAATMELSWAARRDSFLSIKDRLALGSFSFENDVSSAMQLEIDDVDSISIDHASRSLNVSREHYLIFKIASNEFRTILASDYASISYLRSSMQAIRKFTAWTAESFLEEKSVIRPPRFVQLQFIRRLTQHREFSEARSEICYFRNTDEVSELLLNAEEMFLEFAEGQVDRTDVSALVKSFLTARIIAQITEEELCRIWEIAHAIKPLSQEEASSILNLWIENADSEAEIDGIMFVVVTIGAESDVEMHHVFSNVRKRFEGNVLLDKHIQLASNLVKFRRSEREDSFGSQDRIRQFVTDLEALSAPLGNSAPPTMRQFQQLLCRHLVGTASRLDEMLPINRGSLELALRALPNAYSELSSGYVRNRFRLMAELGRATEALTECEETLRKGHFGAFREALMEMRIRLTASAAFWERLYAAKRADGQRAYALACEWADEVGGGAVELICQITRIWPEVDDGTVVKRLQASFEKFRTDANFERAANIKITEMLYEFRRRNFSAAHAAAVSALSYQQQIVPIDVASKLDAMVRVEFISLVECVEKGDLQNINQSNWETLEQYYEDAIKNQVDDVKRRWSLEEGLRIVQYNLACARSVAKGHRNTRDVFRKLRNDRMLSKFRSAVLVVCVEDVAIIVEDISVEQATWVSSFWTQPNTASRGSARISAVDVLNHSNLKGCSNKAAALLLDIVEHEGEELPKPFLSAIVESHPGLRERAQRARRQKTILSEPKVRRNGPCSCGSGKKFKDCCYKK